jgi:hypothetical protein
MFFNMFWLLSAPHIYQVFIKIDSVIQKLIGGYTETETGRGVHKPTLGKLAKNHSL